MSELISNHGSRSPKRWPSYFVVAIVFFLVGLAVGRDGSPFKRDLDNKNGVEISRVLNVYSKTRSSSVDFNQYWEVWDKIKQKYASQPVSDVDLFYGSIEGLVNSLGDPYSAYFPPKKAEQFAKDLSGEFEGIGAEIGLRDNQLEIIAPLPGSPAEVAGLKSKDKIIKIDDKDTAGLTLEEAVEKIRGPKGSSVKLLYVREKQKEAKEITITRQKINVPSVTWKEKDKNIIYLRISYFNETTGVEFDKAVGAILAKSPRGIILDLRSNPGGFLDRSVKVASEWVKDGVIVRERFVNNETNDFPSTGLHRFAGIPTVVLVDEGTASGAEIVAGALQDYAVAKVVGAKTYGKGSVQDVEPLKDGSALKLTIAKWFTPKNRGIDKTGIQPDIVLKEMFVPIGTPKEGEKGDFKDLGIDKAIELLTP